MFFTGNTLAFINPNILALAAHHCKSPWGSPYPRLGTTAISDTPALPHSRALFACTPDLVEFLPKETEVVLKLKSV
ncbi:hypothetical protein NQZ68_000111 [Dissostichus eleginoides]|nr:hypothetical protein NQZ68_000111 [Dissostichus eleginoides]